MATHPPSRGKPHNFLWIDRSLFDHGVPALVGPSAWTIYTVLTRHADVQGYAYPSVKGMQRTAGLSNKTVIEALKLLVQYGLILKVRHGRSRNGYQVLPASSCLSQITHRSAESGRVKNTSVDVKKLHAKNSQVKEKLVPRKDVPDDAAGVDNEQCSRTGQRLLSARGVGEAEDGSCIVEWKAADLLALYLGGADSLRDLVENSPIDDTTQEIVVNRAKWFTLSPKTIERIVMSAEKSHRGSDDARLVAICNGLDEALQKRKIKTKIKPI